MHHPHCQPGSAALAVGRQPGRIGTAVEQHRLNSNATTARVKVGGSRSQFLVLASASTAQMEPQGGAAAGATSSLPAGATEDDAVFMRRAVELAQTAIGKTAPNPIVGCVIVKDGKIVGEGFHPKAGEPHAEVCHRFEDVLRSFARGGFHCKARNSLPCSGPQTPGQWQFDQVALSMTLVLVQY